MAAGAIEHGLSPERRFAFTGKLDLEALRSSFEALVMRHESLRTVFRANAEGLAEQIIEADSTGYPADRPLRLAG